MNSSLLIVLAFGLSMDAFAVSVVNGMVYSNLRPVKIGLACGLAFGLFQAAMPLAGYLMGIAFSSQVEQVDHWVALILLSFIGGKMIVEAVRDRRSPGELELCVVAKPFTLRDLLIQGVATSIDALAVGVSLAVIGGNAYFAVSVIGLITFCCSFAGVFIGRRFGSLLKDKAEILGGIILIIIGIHIFWEHLQPVLHG